MRGGSNPQGGYSHGNSQGQSRSASEPTYALPQSLWHEAKRQGQAAGGKLLWMICARYFEGVEFCADYSLPKSVEGFYRGFSGRTDKAREMRDAKRAQKPEENALKTEGANSPLTAQTRSKGPDLVPTDREGVLSNRGSNEVSYIPPTLEEVEGYRKAQGLTAKAEPFIDYYEARGWKSKGGDPIADWRAAYRSWDAKPFSARHEQPGKYDKYKKFSQPGGWPPTPSEAEQIERWANYGIKENGGSNEP